jgi:WD40 repeat protein
LEEQASFLAYDKRLPVDDLQYSPDGKKLATFDGSGEVKVWDVSSQKCLHTFAFRPPYRGAHGGFLASGELLLATQLEPISDGWEVWTCNVKTGAKERVRASERNEFAFPLWADKNLLVVQEDPRYPYVAGPLRFIDLSREKKDVVVKCDDLYRVLTFSPDRRHVVLQVGTQKPEARVIEIATGTVVARFPIGFNSCVLSADNKTLVSLPHNALERGSVSIWDVVTNKELCKRKAFSRVGSLGELAPDGRSIAMILWPRMVQFLDVKRQQFGVAYVLSTKRDADFLCLRFAPDGKTFATGERNGMVRIFETPRFQEPKESGSGKNRGE